MAKILVTGALGFIGKNITERYPRVLGQETTELIALDRLENARVVCDLRRSLPVTLPGTTEDTEYRAVFHLAAETSVRSFELHGGANEEMLHNLLAWATKHSVKRLVFASSSSVYGNSTSMKESSTCLPISEYGMSKLACEQIITEWCAKTGSRAISLRLFNVMGQHQRPNMLPALICDQMKNGGPDIEIYGHRLRNWTYVGDVVWSFFESYRKLSEVEPGSHMIVNMGGTSGVFSQRQLIELYESVTGISVRTVPGPPNKLDVSSTLADMTLFKQLFDWSPHPQNLLKSIVEVASDYGLYSSHN